MAKLEIGSTRQPVSLWLTSHETKMSVVKKNAVNIEVPDKYDPTLSTTAIYPSSHEDEVEIYNLGPKQANLKPVTITGNEIEDTISMTFGDELETSFRAIFVGIESSLNEKLTKKTDGFLGLAPYTASKEFLKDRNFMYQLKKNGYIDHIVFSVYMSMKEGDTKQYSHVKFGGWDKEGIDNSTSPEGLTFLKTMDPSSWAIEMESARIGNTPITLSSKKTYALIELAYPFIYMPQSDFQELATIINDKYGDMVCTMSPKMTCIIPYNCDRVTTEEFLSITLTD